MPELDFGSLKEKKNVNEKKDQVSRSKTRRVPLHVLNENNLLIFIKQCNRTKVYEMKHRFYNNTSSEISTLVEKLLLTKILERNRNGWISVNPNHEKGGDKND